MTARKVLDFLAQRPSCRVALIVHQRPDGDAIGSGLGLASLLRAAGYQASLVNASPIPGNLLFLVDPDLLLRSENDGWWTGFDCVGMLDFGDASRADDINRAAIAHLPSFNIDHHVTSTGLGEAAWIEPDASSTGEMVVRLAGEAGWRLSPFAAQALWTAIITDTGRFSYENSSPPALAAARECLLAGAEPVVAAREIYQSVSRAERFLQARVLERLEFHAGGRLGISWLRHGDFAEAGIGVEGAQDLINLVRDTSGVEVAIFLYEPSSDVPGVKVSLRTQSPHSALDIATRYGGGGHTRAAGASLASDLATARQTVLADATAAYFPLS